MAHTTPYKKDTWNTLHENGPFDLKILYVTELEGEERMHSKTARYNDAAQEIQRLIKETADAGERFGHTGRGASFRHRAKQRPDALQQLYEPASAAHR
ncbi:MAG: hypothetical protein U5K69_11160 [Balneolaceae bacterium]|nr:hypothetical protein [Balneolaceae bacterium]